MERFLHFKAIDYIEEDSFVRWVNRSPLAEDFDWSKWISENPKIEEEVDKAKRLVANLKFEETEIAKGTEDRLWEGISKGIAEKEIVTKSRSFTIRRLAIGAAAAVVGLVLFFNVFSQSDGITESTKYAEVNSIDLPDGSNATVNALSTISFNEKTWATERKVYLKGEAFFQVEKGSSFVVETENGSVEVLGTSFNVFSRGNEFIVSCKTGRVLVKTSDNQQELIPNQSVVARNNKVEFIEKNTVVNSRLSWLDGVYRYEKENLSEVVKELERQLDYQIDIPEVLTDRSYSGSFNKNNKEEALSEVFWPLGLEFNIEGKNVEVREK